MKTKPINKYKCKNRPCGKQAVILVGLHKFCSYDCAIDFGKRKAEEKKKKDNAKQRRELKENELKTRKAAAKKACHDYIRERDKDKLCICCDKRLDKVFHAGHFWESGNYPSIRYDEDNIHGQRVDCNMFKGGDSGFYREKLVGRIGLEKVERLDRLRHEKVKRTASDYKEIEAYFKKKLKELNDGNGV